MSVILKLSTPCILAVNHFLLFKLKAHYMLNTYIYHQLPPTYIYAVQQDTQSFLMIEFIHHIC